MSWAAVVLRWFTFQLQQRFAEPNDVFGVNFANRVRTLTEIADYDYWDSECGHNVRRGQPRPSTSHAPVLY